MVPRPLTDFDLLVLLAIPMVDKRAHAAAIAREIELRGFLVVMEEIRAALDRLEHDGLLVSAAGKRSPQRGSRPRRIFEVTPAGLQAVESAQRARAELWSRSPELQDEQLARELVDECGARRSQVWLWYMATRCLPAYTLPAQMATE